MSNERPAKRSRNDESDSDVDMRGPPSASEDEEDFESGEEEEATRTLPKLSTKSYSSAKRPAIPDPPSETEKLPKKHLLFKKWAVSQGVIIHSSIRPAALPGRGIGLQTTAAIPANTRILFIPEKAIFKPRQDDAAGRKNISPHAHLALSVLKVFPRDTELVLWSDTWPKESEIRASLPLFWDQELRDRLPPSTKAILERQEQDFKADKVSTNKKRRAFDYFWAIVNSRSFHWKPPGSKPGYMVLCPFIDYLNHGPQGTGVNVQQTNKGFEVRTDRAYAPNEEVLLTYGAHSNDKLLVHYGFMHTPPTEDSPSDDSIPLDHIILPKLSETTKSTLQNTGYLGAYSYDPARDEYCFRTQVAIRAQLFSANEWEYFCLNGEDMGVDRSGMVREWLEVPLEEYLEDSRVNTMLWKEWVGEVDKKSGRDDRYAVQMLRSRWKQIEEGLERALGVEKKEDGGEMEGVMHGS